MKFNKLFSAIYLLFSLALPSYSCAEEMFTITITPKGEECFKKANIYCGLMVASSLVVLVGAAVTVTYAGIFSKQRNKDMKPLFIAIPMSLITLACLVAANIAEKKSEEMEKQGFAEMQFVSR